MKIYDEEDLREMMITKVGPRCRAYQLAAMLGVTQTMLGYILRGQRGISNAVAERFGFKRVFVKVKK